MHHSSGSGWHRLGTASDYDEDVDGSGSSSGVELRSSSATSSVASGFIVVHGDGGPSMGAGISNDMRRQDGDEGEEGIGGDILAMGSESDFRALTRRLHSEEYEPVGGLDGGGELPAIVAALAGAQPMGLYGTEEEEEAYCLKKMGILDQAGSSGGVDFDEYGFGDEDEGDAGVGEMVALGTSNRRSRGSRGKEAVWETEGRRIVRSEEVSKKMMWLTGMAAIGGFLFGYDTGVISGAMLPLARAFDLTAAQEEVVVSSTILSAFFFSLIGGSINNSFGRRRTILFAASVFTVGSILLASAWSYASLIAGRIVVGVGIGIASLTTPVYIAEVSKPSMRGTLVTVNALLICVGQFVAGMVDGIFEEMTADKGGWRFMLGLASIPSLIMFIGFLQLPESPRWLVLSGRTGEALDVLRSVRDTDHDASEELAEIIDGMHGTGDHGEDLSMDLVGTDGGVSVGRALPPRRRNMGQKNFFVRVADMLSDRPTQRALVLGCGIMALQQLSGINTVMYYAASIYEMSEFDGKLQFVVSLTIIVVITGYMSSPHCDFSVVFPTIPERGHIHLAERIHSLGTGGRSSS